MFICLYICICSLCVKYATGRSANLKFQPLDTLLYQIYFMKHICHDLKKKKKHPRSQT